MTLSQQVKGITLSKFLIITLGGFCTYNTGHSSSYYFFILGVILRTFEITAI